MDKVYPGITELKNAQKHFWGKELYIRKIRCFYQIMKIPNKIDEMGGQPFLH